MNKKYLDALVIILITVSVTAVVFMFLESKSSKNDKEISENNVSSDVSKEENIDKIDYSEYYYADEINIPDRFEKKEFLDNKSKLKVLFKDGNYEVFTTNCSINNTDPTICKDKTNIDSYYVVDTSNNNIYFAYNTLNYSRGYSKYYYNFLEYSEDSDFTNGIIDVKHQNIIVGYDEYSCEFHSDATIEVCSSEETTIVQKNNKFGVVKLEDGSLIIDVKYDLLDEDENGNFIVKLNGKFGVLSSTGKTLLDIKYDYIGYSKYTGYICITGENLELYNNKLELDSENLENKFTKGLADDNAERLVSYNKTKTADSEPFERSEFLRISNADSYYWGSGSIIVKQNVNDKFYESSGEKENDSYRFKYTGNKFTGIKLIIYSIYEDCHGDTAMYIIDNNKAYKIDKSEISKSGEAFCF